MLSRLQGLGHGMYALSGACMHGEGTAAGHGDGVSQGVSLSSDRDTLPDSVGNTREGVGLSLAPHAKAALKCWQAVSSRILTGEFLTGIDSCMPLQINPAQNTRINSTQTCIVS